ncbi:MAG: hypothetical protein JXA13_07090 [Anaerolineales bacterium]|nr:hypothetical protein [Anaerolineales bacterium]
MLKQHDSTRKFFLILGLELPACSFSRDPVTGYDQSLEELAHQDIPGNLVDSAGGSDTEETGGAPLVDPGSESSAPSTGLVAGIVLYALLVTGGGVWLFIYWCKPSA